MALTQGLELDKNQRLLEVGVRLERIARLNIDTVVRTVRMAVEVF